jgi:ribosomal protein L44E
MSKEVKIESCYECSKRLGGVVNYCPYCGAIYNEQVITQQIQEAQKADSSKRALERAAAEKAEATKKALERTETEKAEAAKRALEKEDAVKVKAETELLEREETEKSETVFIQKDGKASDRLEAIEQEIENDNIQVDYTNKRGSLEKFKVMMKYASLIFIAIILFFYFRNGVVDDAYSQGLRCFNEGNYVECINKMDNILKKDPYNKNALELRQKADIERQLHDTDTVK